MNAKPASLISGDDCQCAECVSPARRVVGAAVPPGADQVQPGPGGGDGLRSRGRRRWRRVVAETFWVAVWVVVGALALAFLILWLDFMQLRPEQRRQFVPAAHERVEVLP